MRLAEYAFGILHDLSGRDQEVVPTRKLKNRDDTLSIRNGIISSTARVIDSVTANPLSRAV